MGIIQKVQTAWSIYTTVKGFLTKEDAVKDDVNTQAAKRRDRENAEEAVAAASTQTSENAGGLIHLDEAAAAIAAPLLTRVKRTAVKGAVAVGVIAVATKVVPWYIKRKLSGEPKV